MADQRKVPLVLRPMAKFISTRPGAWLVLNVANPIDRRIMRWSKGRLRLFVGSQVGLLEVRGRKSGKLRETPLAYVRDGDRVVLIASSGGATKHPVWYLNVTANPEVSFTAKGSKRDYLAHTAEGEERKAMWKRASTYYAGYDTYQQRTEGREIPVVVLEPR
jgi:deazaflavin-dependent oxidoreductase (nitroreductase family)